MSEQIERNGKTYRKMKVGELVQKGDIMNSMLGWTGAFAGTSYEVDNNGACYYRQVGPEVKPVTPAPIDDGGPAFARTGHECTNGDWVVPQNGMTLRDWFAGNEKVDPSEHFQWELCEALAGPRPIKSRATDPVEWEIWQAAWQARIRFIRADAMIKARREVQHG
jgi:hypothetical protein